MSTLKRTLSLVLALVMVLCMVPVLAGAANLTYEDITDKADIENEEAVSLLVDLGIINGYEDGSYKPTNAVSRAEFAKLMVYMLVGEDAAATLASVTNTSSFTDVLNSDAVWAAGFIEYLYEKGIVAGKGEGKFDPLSTVTAQEAAKMLVAAMGYDAAKEGLVGASWAINANALAGSVGIYKNYTDNGKSVGATLNRDDAALLIFNTLSVPQVVLPEDSKTYDWKNNDTKSESTRLYELGIERVVGTMVANQYSSIYGSFTTSGTKIATVDDSKDGNPISTKTYAISSNVEDLGSEVAFYITTRNSKVYSSLVVSTDNTAVVATNVSGSNYNAMKSSVSYASTVDIYSNFVLADDDLATKAITSSVANGGATATPGKGKTVTYYDLNDDGDVDAISVVAYTFTQVSTKSSSSIKLIGNTSSYASDKVVNGFDDVAADDYVLYLVANDYIVDVQVAETMQGTMTSFSTNASDSVGTNLKIDGTTYDWSSLANATDLLDNGRANGNGLDDGKFSVVGYVDTEALFYMDANGYILAADTDVTGGSSGNYLFILEVENNTANSSGTLSSNYYKAGVILSDGSEKTIEIAVAKYNGAWYIKNTNILCSAGAAALVGNIFGYSVDSDGYYVIGNGTTGTGGSGSTSGLKTTNVSNTGKTLGVSSGNSIAANQSKIGTITGAYANASTVLAFAKQESGNSYYSFDSSYVGYSKFPTIGIEAATTVKYVANNSGTIVFAVVLNSNFTDAKTYYAAYIGYSGYTSKGYSHKLAIDGVETTVLSDERYAGYSGGDLVTYKVSSSDKYTLAQVTTYAYQGTVTSVTSTAVTIAVVNNYGVSLGSVTLAYGEDYYAYDAEEDCEVTSLTRGAYVKFVADAAIGSATEILIASTFEELEFDTVPTYTVTFNSNGGSAVASQSVTSGGTATQPADPTLAGYNFMGWYSDAALTTPYVFTTAVTGAITLYAKWEAVTITPVSIGSISVAGPVTGSALATGINSIAANGCSFTSIAWTDGTYTVSGNAVTGTTYTASIVLTAASGYTFTGATVPTTTNVTSAVGAAVTAVSCVVSADGTTLTVTVTF